MWRFTSIPAYIWCMLLLPPVVIAIIAGIRRSYLWALMLSFSLGAVVGGVVESFYWTFVRNRYDEKFRHAPTAAFELSLFGDAIIALLGLCLIGCGLAVFKPKHTYPNQGQYLLLAILGALYMAIPPALYWNRILPTPLFWCWVVLIPIIAARLMLSASRSPE